ncbi:MAG: hypothetical protein QJR09_08160 [Micrococcus sp.]|nr:hypothetical protein [Micrococcus sp.]
MTGLVLVLCGVGVGLLIGAALFAGPPANMERERVPSGRGFVTEPGIDPPFIVTPEHARRLMYPPSRVIKPVSVQELDASDDD